MTLLHLRKSHEVKRADDIIGIGQVLQVNTGKHIKYIDFGMELVAL